MSYTQCALWRRFEVLPGSIGSTICLCPDRCLDPCRSLSSSRSSSRSLLKKIKTTIGTMMKTDDDRDKDRDDDQPDPDCLISSSFLVEQTDHRSLLSALQRSSLDIPCWTLDVELVDCCILLIHTFIINATWRQRCR